MTEPGGAHDREQKPDGRGQDLRSLFQLPDGAQKLMAVCLALAFLESAQDSGANLVLAPQNLAEFYAVVTNPRRVSTPLSASDARAEVENLTRLPGLRVLDVPADVVMR